MNKYYVKMQVSFSAEIIAENEKQAEELAYSGWGETADALIPYDGVESIEVDDLGEACDECEAVDCDCEDEEEDVA
jgi:hypothetical protein